MDAPQISPGCSSPAALPERKGLKEIRESKLLKNFPSRIADIEALRKDNTDFQILTSGKIQHMGKNMQHYAYTSEGVEDTSWGCAWRAIQTMLSSYYHGNTASIPGFQELYKKYCTHEFMQEQFAKIYPSEAKTTHDWKAPEDDWHMWADPFVARIILSDLTVDATLYSVQNAPRVLSPNVNDGNVTFPQFREKLVEHFQKQGFPLVIDNGKFALNILGVGTSDDGKTHLLIGDPHLLFEREDHPLNGLYVVTLDQEGRQIAYDYPRQDQHFYDDENGYSYNVVDFSPGKEWLVTQSLQYS